MTFDRHLPDTTLAGLAAVVDQAALTRTPVAMLTEAHPDMSLGDAYAVQAALRKRMEARRVRVTGLKMGLTSRAKMQQMGVAESIHGFITDQQVHGEGSEIAIEAFIHPRIEAEIAVVMKHALSGPHCTPAQAAAAVDFVLPAIEIIDSRYADFKFDIRSVVADNTSAAGYVVGARSRDLAELDLVTEGVVLSRNGRIVELGAGAAVLGNPLEALAMLANQRAALGYDIPAGSLVLTGGITAAVAVSPDDDVFVQYQSLGTVRMRFI
jgi:2-oxo-3-hexenedioate decarboxylase